MAAVPMCRLRANRPAFKLPRQGPNRQRFGPCALRAQAIAAEYCAFVQYSCKPLQTQALHVGANSKIDHLCQLNFDQGSKAGCLAPGCG